MDRVVELLYDELTRKLCEEANDEDESIKRAGWYGPGAAVKEKKRSKERKAWVYS
jgi:hypothetical protein